MVSNKAILEKINADIYKALETIDTKEPKNTIYDRENSKFKTLPVRLPKEELRIKVSNKIKNAIDEVSKKEYKLISIYDHQLLFIEQYLTYYFSKIEKIVFVDAFAIINSLLKIKKINLERIKQPKTQQEFIIDLNRKRMHVKLLREGQEVIIYPVEFKKLPTRKECMSYILKELNVSQKTMKVKLNKQKVFYLSNFENFLGTRFLFPNSEIKFLEAILELSKEYTIIIADPRNFFGKGVPKVIGDRVGPLIINDVEPNPYNIASTESFPILKKILSEATLVKSGR